MSTKLTILVTVVCLVACAAPKQMPTVEELAAEFRGIEEVSISVWQERAELPVNAIYQLDGNSMALAVDIWGVKDEQFELYFLNLDTDEVYPGKMWSICCGGAAEWTDYITICPGPMPLDDVGDMALALANAVIDDEALTEVPVARSRINHLRIGLEKPLPSGSYLFYIHRNGLDDPDLIRAPEGTIEERRWVLRFTLNEGGI